MAPGCGRGRSVVPSVWPHTVRLWQPRVRPTPIPVAGTDWGDNCMNNRWSCHVLCVGLVVCVLACSSGATIGAVVAAPQDYESREVTLTGIVTDQVSGPFVQRSLYRIQDESGTIWVLGVGSPPGRNESRTVRGTVEKGITLGTRTFGVLLKETESP